MDAHLFRIFARRLEPLLSGARIERIQEFAPGHLAIGFFGCGQKRNLYLRFGHKEPFCFLSAERVGGMPQPSPQVMRMRKYFAGHRIAAVVTQEWSRKIWLLASGAPLNGAKTTWLCLDLAEGVSLHFLEDDKAPAREEAMWPQTADIANAMANWRDWAVLTPSLRRTLARLPPPEQAALLADLADGGGDIFAYSDAQGHVRKVSAWPLSQNGGLRETANSDVLGCLEKAGKDLVLGALAEQEERRLLAPGKRRERQIRKTLDKLAGDEARLLVMVGRAADAQMLAANLWRLPTAEKLDSVEIDGRRIALERRFSLLENMKRMFNEVRRGQRGLAVLAERRASLQEELKNIAGFHQSPISPTRQPKAHVPATANPPPHTQAFVSSDGYLILRGKDAKGNLALLRLAAGHDIWAHVEQGVGSHVIIRRPHAGHAIPEQTLLEAGTLAVNKSWLSQASSGNVMFAEVRHVKPCRTGPPGKVTIDKIRQTLIVPIDHGLEERLKKRD